MVALEWKIPSFEMDDLEVPLCQEISKWRKTGSFMQLLDVHQMDDDWGYPFFRHHLECPKPACHPCPRAPLRESTSVDTIHAAPEKESTPGTTAICSGSG